MTILVLGRSGQLATELAALAHRRAVPAADGAVAGIEFLGREACDLRDAGAVERALERTAARTVVNAAAYTQVEQAERDPTQAFLVNGQAVGALARACAARGVRLIHVSTDYVFDGASRVPYTPEATPAPLCVYGASKLEGERLIAATPGLDWLCLRTSWVYSATGRNFLLTMLGLFRTRGAASVVDDQFGSPTSAASLAGAVWAALHTPAARGLLHFADAGVASWWEFATAIAGEALERGLLAAAPVVTPIPTSAYPTLARRPAYSALDASAALAALGLRPRSWREALGRTLDGLAHA